MNAYRSIPSIGSFLVLHHRTMDIGHDDVSVGHCVASVDHGIVSIDHGVVSINHGVLGVGEHDMCIDCEFSLQTGNQQCWGRNDGTHLEDMKDLVELSLPARDLFLVVPRVQKT